jgi:hypothetical protein
MQRTELRDDQKRLEPIGDAALEAAKAEGKFRKIPAKRRR